MERIVVQTHFRVHRRRVDREQLKRLRVVDFGVRGERKSKEGSALRCQGRSASAIVNPMQREHHRIEVADHLP
jgi:hypothetical protein